MTTSSAQFKGYRFVFKLWTLDNNKLRSTNKTETTRTWPKLSKLSYTIHWTIALGSRPGTQCFPKMFKLYLGNNMIITLFLHKWYRSPSKLGPLMELSHERSWVIIFKATTHIQLPWVSVTFRHWIIGVRICITTYSFYFVSFAF